MESLKKFFVGVGEEIWDRVILSYKSTLIGLVVACALAFVTYTTNYLSTVQKPWANALAFLVAAIGMYLKSLPVQNARMAKRAALKATVAILFLGLATPAFAETPLVHCFMGCPKTTMQLKAPMDGGEQVTASLWVGPSLGLQPYIFDAQKKTWDLSFRPTFGYGFKYKPATWTATKALIAMDFFVSGDFSTMSYLDVVPTMTFMDSIMIGFGPRFHFASPNSGSKVTGLLAIGFGTSFGSP